MITLAKRGDLHARRQALAYMPAQAYVVSVPAGIDCVAGASENTGTCAAAFTDDQVRLIASPADGDRFRAWTPNCIVEEPAVCLIENPRNHSTINVDAAFFPN